MKIANSADKTV